jgi:hypothetical protein
MHTYQHAYTHTYIHLCRCEEARFSGDSLLIHTYIYQHTYTHARICIYAGAKNLASLVIVSSGPTAFEVVEVLEALGVSDDVASQMGVCVLKLYIYICIYISQMGVCMPTLYIYIYIYIYIYMYIW